MCICDNVRGPSAASRDFGFDSKGNMSLDAMCVGIHAVCLMMISIDPVIPAVIIRIDFDILFQTLY